MKYLYLQYLKVRVFMLRRRLRRLGFRDVAENTHPLTLLRLKIEHVPKPSQIMRWLEIALLITGLAVWLHVYLRVTAEGHASKPSQPHAAPIQHLSAPSSALTGNANS
jgi:hypothetical protein